MPGPVALISHLPSQGAVAGPQGMPVETARSGNSQLGVGAAPEAALPIPLSGKG